VFQKKPGTHIKPGSDGKIKYPKHLQHKKIHPFLPSELFEKKQQDFSL